MLAAITFILTIGAVEGTAWLGLWVLESGYNIRYEPRIPSGLEGRHKRALKAFIKDKYDLTGFSADLGWTNKPNAIAGEGAYTTNSIGVRGPREYPLNPPDGNIRITTFGDSFTWGQQVRDNETWQEQLTQSNPKFEVINFGISGHGLDQAYIRYLNEGIALSPDIVVIGFMTENINRIVNVYRPYYLKQTGIPLTKPRFTLSAGQLELLENPYKKLEEYNDLLNDWENTARGLGENDFFYHSRYSSHPIDFLRIVRVLKIVKHDMFTNQIYDKDGSYNTQSEAYQLLLGIVENFYQTIIENGAVPMVLIYPQFTDIRNHGANNNKNYQPIVSWLEQQNYNFIDLMDAFEEYRDSKVEGDFFHSGMGHYSPLGNKFVAKVLMDYLIQQGMDSKQ